MRLVVLQTNLVVDKRVEHAAIVLQYNINVQNHSRQDSPGQAGKALGVLRNMRVRQAGGYI